MLVWLFWAAMAEHVIDDALQRCADWYWQMEYERVVAEMARASRT